MTTISRHHTEWLSLLEISGPFLSLPVLMDAFPNGVDSLESRLTGSLRAAYEEWADNQGGLKPDPAIHTAWVKFVLSEALGYDEGFLLDSQAIPAGMKASFPEHAETIRPDLALVDSRTQKPRLLIQIFPASQKLDQSLHGSRWQASVATRMMELLHATSTRLGLITNGEQWMLVDAPIGETTGFISWYAPLWFEEPLTLRAFVSLLSLQRFFGVQDEETIEALLARSSQDQHEVTDQLGYQVRSAVEILVRSLDKADQDNGRILLSDIAPFMLYEAALTVMMRLVFLMSAEERKMLPLDDPFYAQNYAISTLCEQLRETADEEVLERRFDAWNRLLATFRVVYGGVNHDRLKLMAYGGSLFDPDRFPFLEGRLAETKWTDTPAAPLPVNNRTVLHLLESLQFLNVSVPGGGIKEARRLSFRALDIEQIGHVYESLLDHIVVRAPDLILGLAGTKNKEPEIPLLRLEELIMQGEDQILNFLHEESGRSKSAIKTALGKEPDAWEQTRLLSACGNQEALFNRIYPFAGLVREDDYGNKVVIPAGSLYVTQGSTRRSTGTHYTPRSLTEPIVQHTLEPLVYIGPAEGFPKEEWQLRSPKDLLDLKICDMAMGSGAFLVQVCRYLSERLVEAWQITLDSLAIGKNEREAKDIFVNPDGELTNNPDKAIPIGDEDRLILAKRLVADRCLYGVDKNPLAVEMAKLSLWLVTLDKNRAFTFLDHAFKCVDSLVGADEEMYRQWAYSLKGAQFTLYLTTLEEMVATAREKRKELEGFLVMDVNDADHKARLLKDADEAMARVKLGCDLLVGVRLMGLTQSEQEQLLAHLLWDYVAGLPMESIDAQNAMNAAKKERGFHWPFEFPEVFEIGGFSAIIGNPPFMGGQKISGFFGEDYREYLVANLANDKRGSADLCSYFFLQSVNLTCVGGTVGMIATNTIAQGVTREVGLDHIINTYKTIFNAITSQKWPGSANLQIAVIHIFHGDWKGKVYLDNNEIGGISSLLSEADEKIIFPKRISSNFNKAFQGTILQGLGFVLSSEEASKLLSDHKYKDVIKPYIIGNDLTTSPTLSPSRFVINFQSWDPTKCKSYSIAWNIVLEKVFPARQKIKREIRKQNWWQFAEKAKGMYLEISHLSEIIAFPLTSKHASPVIIEYEDDSVVLDQSLIVIASSHRGLFACLSSSLHYNWIIQYGTPLETRPRYSVTKGFETFPFPNIDLLLDCGEKFHTFRKQIMVNRKEGLTTIYNRFHNRKETETDFDYMRKLQEELDKAVVNAYGWNDLDLEHDFHLTKQGERFTISESARREVLSRLLLLNHERYEEEVRQGLHDKTGKKKENHAKKQKPKKIAQPKAQMPLIEPIEHTEEKPEDVQEKEEATPPNEIGAWDQCVCLGCGKHLAGFTIGEHTNKVHGGKDPGFRKINS